MNVLARVVLNGVGLLLAARIVPGVSYDGGLVYLLLAGAVIGLINVLVKPVVTILALPAVLLTFGLFYLVINGLMFWLAAGLLDGLEVAGCLPAILGGLVLTAFNVVVRALRRN
ncbi:MAG: phage holin family protein [Acidobacteriota bacterium]|nr:phage holin family protein [Acidobacteriota bacterium]MDH3521990.1 phage holin family protein [Acidobacteriota bacterium]